MKYYRICCLLFFTCVFQNVSGQSGADSLDNVAMRYLQEGKHKEAAMTWGTRNETYGGTGTSFYNAAFSWALINEGDKAIVNLDSAFLYGFTNLNHVMTDPDLNSIRNRDEYKQLIDRERQFYADSVITMTDVVKALATRKVVVFRNKRVVSQNRNWADPEFPIDEVLDQLDSDTQIKLTEDSLFDFRDRTLSFYECKGQVRLDRLKLKSLTIENFNNLRSDVVGQSRLSIIKLNHLDLASFSFYLVGQTFVEFEDVTAKEIVNNHLQSIGTFSIISSDLTHYRPYNEAGTEPIHFWGTLANPIGYVFMDLNVFREFKGGTSVIPLIIYANAFTFRRNKVEGELTFFSSNFKSNVDISDNVFERAVDISGATFPSSNLYIPFDQFKEGFGVLDKGWFRPWEVMKSKLLITGTYEEVKYRNLYDNLIHSYKRVFNNYRERGDLLSANASYVRLKEIMLERDYLTFQENKTFQNFINYQIGVLLKVYTDSGTSPSKAIVISFFIIIAFSFLYVFYPSEWDRKSKPKMIADFRLFREKNEHGYFKPLIMLTSGFALSWFNAFVLSLNAFVTLGFGAIPTTGLARYLCIIEGFLGWFLLSIFTVSLINQVLA